MAAEPISVDLASIEAIVRVRDIEIMFRYIDGRLKVVTRENFSGGRSTYLTDAEYVEALTLAAERLGVKIKLHRRAA